MLFKSPGVFLKYYKNDAATQETKTPDGWVHTGDAGFFDQRGHLKIIDRAKDVGRLNNGALFAPKYLENRIKFYPEVREAVAFGQGRDYVTMFINIDLISVGNWAERNNVSYASYQELAAHPQVYDIIAKRVDELNKALADEPQMAASQIRRFLILHKELDADDGELTRTLKVRRSFIADRYGPLITALYDGSKDCHVATEVTFEDGRKGVVEGDMRIVDMKTYPARAPPSPCGRPPNEGRRRAEARGCGPGAIAAGDVLLSLEHVSLSFGGVKALRDVSFDIRKGEIRAIIGPNGAGKTSMLNVINGFYHPQEGVITFKGQRRHDMRPYLAASQGIARTFQNVALFKGMSTLDNIMTGRTLKMRRGVLAHMLHWGACAERGDQPPRGGRAHHRFPGDRAHPQDAGRQAALRPAEARRARPRAGHGAGAAAARRADGRHEPRGEAGHEPLHPHRQGHLRHHHRADRARHERGDGPVRPRRGPQLRRQDRRRHAGARCRTTRPSSRPISA